MTLVEEDGTEEVLRAATRRLSLIGTLHEPRQRPRTAAQSPRAGRDRDNRRPHRQCHRGGHRRGRRDPRPRAVEPRRLALARHLTRPARVGQAPRHDPDAAALSPASFPLRHRLCRAGLFRRLHRQHGADRHRHPARPRRRGHGDRGGGAADDICAPCPRRRGDRCARPRQRSRPSTPPRHRPRAARGRPAHMGRRARRASGPASRRAISPRSAPGASGCGSGCARPRSRLHAAHEKAAPDRVGDGLNLAGSWRISRAPTAPSSRPRRPSPRSRP